MDSLLSRSAVGPWDQYYIKEPQKLPGAPIIDIPCKRIREITNSKNYDWLRWKAKGEVAQSCPTLCIPVDCSLPGSSIHGILQARILEWVAMSFSVRLVKETCKFWIYEGFCELASATSPVPSLATHYLLLTIRWLDLCCFHFYEALPTFLDLDPSQPPRCSSVMLSPWKPFHEPSGCACCQSLRSPWKVLDGDKVLEDGGREGGTKCMYGQICLPIRSHFFGLNRGRRMGKKIWEEFLNFLVLVSVLFLWASLVAQMGKNLPAMQETRVQSLGWEDLLEKGMATHSSTLAWRIPWTEEPGRL